jgi:tetratricopeptide (TPR) repeat protein
MYHRQGHYDLAIEMHLNCQEIASRHENYLTAAKSYENMGLVYTEQSNYEAAVKMLRKAVHIYERLRMEPKVAQIYWDLADLNIRMDETMLAFMDYDRSLVFSERTGNFDAMPKIYLTMGQLYQHEEKLTQAREYFQKAQTIFESIEDFENAKKAKQLWRQLWD